MAQKALLLETSQKTGLVALAEGERVLGQRRLDEARRHARDLVPFVRALLDEQGWKARDLDAVIVSIGPGSYTGLRVGVMSAKTLAYATGCALVGVETFAALARQAPAAAERIDVLGDAQQGKVYLQRFQCSPLAPRADSAPVDASPPGTIVSRSETTTISLAPRADSALRIIHFDEWLAAATAESANNHWVTGPGLAVHADQTPPTVHVTSVEDWRIKAETLLLLGLERLRRGERDDPYQLQPLYLRASQAEQQWRGR